LTTRSRCPRFRALVQCNAFALYALFSEPMQRSKHNNKPFNKYNNAAVLQVFHEYTCMACSPLTISPKTVTRLSFLLVGGGIRDEDVRNSIECGIVPETAKGCDLV
jgi:hypothetical protein